MVHATCAQCHQHFQRVTKLGNIIEGRKVWNWRTSFASLSPMEPYQAFIPLLPIQVYLLWLLPEDNVQHSWSPGNACQVSLLLAGLREEKLLKIPSCNILTVCDFLSFLSYLFKTLLKLCMNSTNKIFVCFSLNLVWIKMSLFLSEIETACTIMTECFSWCIKKVTNCLTARGLRTW